MSGKPFKTVDFKNNPDLKKFVLKDAERTGRKLGVGSFGAVVEVTVGGTYFAGKRLHDNLLDSYGEGHTRLLERFVSECKIMSELRHPNIVQFMGLCFFDESIYPVLVMEQLDTSLDDLLEKRKKNFTLTPKLHILHNVAAGLLYLHDQCNPPIIHRDLTTRNVLVNTSSMQAKIADLGNALMIDTAKFSSTLSQMPGILSYMPPEATALKPKYDSSLDMFSFGHLSLYTIIQEFPADLLPATYEDPDTDELKARNEVTRRGHYFEMLYNKLSEDHVICKMIRMCLSNKPSARPTASLVMDQLEDLIGDEDDPYEVFADVCKLDLLELLNKKDDSGAVDLEASGEILSRTEQIKNGAPGVLEIYRTSIGLLKRSGWKMYFFQMTPSHLKYFKSSALQQRIIDEFKLADVKTVRYATPIQNEDASKFYFEVAGSAAGKSWLLRAHTEEDRTSWMSAIKPSSIRRYTAGMGAQPRDPQIESACYDEIDALRITPSNLQPNEAYNVLEESRRPKSPPIPIVSPPKPSNHLPPPTETPPPLPPKSPPPASQRSTNAQLPPNRPPPSPGLPPQNKQPPLPASPPPRPKEKQSAVSNTYIDITEINAAAFIDDSLYEELPADNDISAAIAASNVALASPLNHPSQKERKPQPYLTPTGNVSEDQELYEDIVNLQTEEPEETYEEMDNTNPPAISAGMPPIPDSLGSEGPPKSPLEKSTKPAPPKYPPGTYHPPVPLPTNDNVYDEPAQEIYDEDVSAKVNNELKKSLYVNIWDGEKPPPPPVPPKPKLKPALPPKPSKVQTAKGEPSSDTGKLPKVNVYGGQATNARRPQRGRAGGPAGVEDEVQQRSKYSFSRRRGNLEQNFTKMMLGPVLGNLLVQNEKLSCVNFLKDKHSTCDEYKEQDIHGPPKSATVLDKSKVFKVYLHGYHSLSRVVSQYYQCAENSTHIPFVDPVTVIVCDHQGIHNTLVDHGITLMIPPGAIPNGKVVHFEMGVALYGPFNFPGNTRPISPILWLCPQEDIEFNSPIIVTLPHFLTHGLSQQELTQLGVGFAKADHNSFSGSKESHNVLFDFQPCSVQPQFSYKKQQGFGRLSTKHCCFLCLTANQCPQLARETGFCLTRIDCKSISSTYVVNFYVSFFLPSCLKVLDMLFPDYIDKNHCHFKFSNSDADQEDGHEQCLHLTLQDLPPNTYTTNTMPSEGKIKMSSVDFWHKGYNEKVMRLKHSTGMYPPRVRVNFIPVVNHHQSCKVQVTITGYTSDDYLNSEISLPLVSCSLSSPSMLNGYGASSFNMPLNVLTEREHLDINSYIKVLDERDIILLGQALGLLRSNLKKMKTLPDQMIDAWLNQADHVLETSGPPTWESFCEALKKIDQPGIAAKIQMKGTLM